MEGTFGQRSRSRHFALPRSQSSLNRVSSSRLKGFFGLVGRLNAPVHVYIQMLHGTKAIQISSALLWLLCIFLKPSLRWADEFDESINDWLAWALFTLALCDVLDLWVVFRMKSWWSVGVAVATAVGTLAILLELHDCPEFLTINPSLQVLKAGKFSRLFYRPTYEDESIEFMRRNVSSAIAWRTTVLLTLMGSACYVVVVNFSADNPAVSIGLSAFAIGVIFSGHALIMLAIDRYILREVRAFLSTIHDLSSSIYTTVNTMNLTRQRGSTASMAESSVHGTIDVPFRCELRKLEKIMDRLKSYVTIHEEKILAKNETDLALLQSIGHIRSSTFSPSIQTPPLTIIPPQSDGFLHMINSWEFNPMRISIADQNRFLSFIFCDRGLLEKEVFFRFAFKVRENYKTENTYHRFEHALDVLQTVYRFLDLTDAKSFLESTDELGLLLAALIHDVGHPGVNNQFLIETSDDLAVRFNDRSPLENFHCSLFFALAKETGVLDSFSAVDSRKLRRVIIDAVLHTDNFYHFTMVKEVSVFNEVNRDTPPEARLDSLRKPESRTLINKLFLHAADISNPAKPFSICREWALLVMEEFFSQGDLERERGIPISPLNDRTKVNIPQSQLGFIEFIVAPLYVQKFKLFPVFTDNCQFIVSNMVQWSSEFLPNSPDAESKLIERCNKVADSFRSLPGTGGLFVPESLRH